MIHDLRILPGDWCLGLWWVTFPASQPDLLTGEIAEGHFLLLVRRLGVAPNGVLAAWSLEEGFREQPGEPLRSGGSYYGALDATAAAIKAHEVVCAFLAARGGIYGWLSIRGGGERLRERLEAGDASLPVWMSVLIVERRPATERSAAG